MLKTRYQGIALVGLLLGLALEANATPISGSIGMGGNFVTVDSDWNPIATELATGVDFDPNLFIINSATEDLSGLSGLGTIEDFQFSPFVGPITDFWTAGGFAFELSSVERGLTNDPTRILLLEGTGILRHDDFDDTQGSWSFTGNTLGGSSGTFTWSGGGAAEANGVGAAGAAGGVGAADAVPEPDILVLLGLGIVLIGFASRKVG